MLNFERWDDWLVESEPQSLVSGYGQPNPPLGFTGLDTELSPIALCSPSLPQNERDSILYDYKTINNVYIDVQDVKVEPFAQAIAATSPFRRRHIVENTQPEALEPSTLFFDFSDTIEAIDRAKRAVYDEDIDYQVVANSPGSDSSSINSTPPPITPPNHLSATIPLPAHLLNSTKDSDSLQTDDGAECTSAERSGRPSGVTTSTNTDGHATRTGYATPPIMENSSSLDRGEQPPSPGAARTHRRSHTRHSPYPVDRDQRGYRGDRGHYRMNSISPHPSTSAVPTGEAARSPTSDTSNLSHIMASDRLGRLRSAKWSPPHSREGSASPSDDATHSGQSFVPRLIRPPPTYSHSRSTSAPHHLPPLQTKYSFGQYYDSPPAHDRSASHPTPYSSYSNRGEFPVSSERDPSHDPPSPASAHAHAPTSTSSATSSLSYRRPRGHSPYSSSAGYTYSRPYDPPAASSYRTSRPYYDHKGKRPAHGYDDHSGSERSNGSGSENEDYDRDADMDYSPYPHGPHSGHRASPPSSRTSSTSRFRVTPPNLGPLSMGPSNSVFSANSSSSSHHHIPNGIPLLLSAASSTGGAPISGRKKKKMMPGETEIPPPPKPTATPTPSFAKKKKSNTGRVKVEESVLDGQRRFLCPLYLSGACNQTFSRRNDAYRHLDSCHRDLQMQHLQEEGETPEPAVFGPDRCGCGQLLSRLDALNRHYKTCKWRKEQGLPPPQPTSAQAGKKRGKSKSQSPKKSAGGKKKGTGSSAKGKRTANDSDSDSDEDGYEEDELESEEEEEDQLMED